jgi:hypothetical protein
MRNPYKKMLANVKRSARANVDKGQMYGRKKALPIEITWRDLKRKFEEQNGLCYFSHKIIDLNSIFESHNILAPSVDRLNSDEGYTYDNICITFRMINVGRGDCSVEQTDKALKVITNNNSKLINNNKLRGDNMDIIDKVIAKGFEINTPDAAKFLKLFAETNSGFVSQKKVKKKSKNEIRNQKIKKTVKDNFTILQNKSVPADDKFRRDYPKIEFMGIKELSRKFYPGWIKPPTYQHLMGGKLGKKLVDPPNGVYYSSTEFPSNKKDFMNHILIEKGFAEEIIKEQTKQ